MIVDADNFNSEFCKQYPAIKEGGLSLFLHAEMEHLVCTLMANLNERQHYQTKEIKSSIFF